jgi:hypothetical protein
VGHFRKFPSLNSVQLTLLVALANWEDDVEQLKRDEDFKNQVFANDPELYRALFKPRAMTPAEEETLDWIVPESPEDAKVLLDELRDIFPLA